MKPLILGVHMLSPKLLSPWGMKGGKFQSYCGAWHKAMNMFVEKYILISRFLAFLEFKVIGKVRI